MSKSKNYIIQLDNKKYDWDFLWSHTIPRIKTFSLNVEIIACIIPTLYIRTVGENNIEHIKNIEGIKIIEEDTGYCLIEASLKL